MSCENLALSIISLLVLFSTVPVKSQEGDSLFIMLTRTHLLQEKYSIKKL